MSRNTLFGQAVELGRSVEGPIRNWYGAVAIDDPSKVRYLYFHCLLEGIIPGELGNLTELLEPKLGGGLTIPIPSGWGHLSNLQVLDLGSNQLMKEFPLCYVL